MAKVTIDHVRTALREINVSTAERMSDTALKNADFLHNLGMNEGKLFSMMNILEKKLGIMLPTGVTDSLQAKNTVAVFITAANHYLIDLSKQ